MENFNIYNPVNLHFGKNVLNLLPSALNQYGDKIMLIYGKSSIKDSGLYQKLMNLLDGFTVIEYGGIKSNPTVSDADAASKLAKEKEVDVILAVGGGSVIDTGKMVSIGAHTDDSIWNFMTGEVHPQKSTPLFAVLTLAATGTEMNPFAVIQNEATKKKIGYGHPFIYPKESYLDPQLTTTVDADYTAYGMVDIIAHVLESYFGEGNAPLSDKFVYSIIEEVMEVSSELLNHLDNYELRARIMYAATMALNGTTLHGRIAGDWGVHAIGHELSFLFDMPHGASLSIVYPAWMRLMIPQAEDRIAELGSALFGAQNAEETIAEFEAFFKKVNSPIRLSEVNIGESDYAKIVKQWNENNVDGMHFKIDKDDYSKLLTLMK